MELIRKAEQTIKLEKLFEPGDRIVVAVSGGPDSMALLHLLHRLSLHWEWQLVAGHVNHQFRKQESEREAEFVSNWAKELGVPCEVGVIDVPTYIRETGDNAQNAAREKRFGFLSEVAGRYQAGKIALAHHADDQAETVLMRIIRGTGPAGLSGISYNKTWRGLQLIRPLLGVYKDELEAYCREESIPFFVDSSNAERKYFRNQIRLDVLPSLKSFNPNIAESLNRLSLMARDEEDYLTREAEAVFERIVSTRKNGEASFSGKAFSDLHVALQRRLIKLILNYLNSCADSVDFTSIESMRSAILKEAPSNLTLDVSDQIRFFKEYDRVSLVKEYNPTAAFEYTLDFSSRGFEIANEGIYAEYFLSEEKVNVGESSSYEQAVFDYDQLHCPLSIRNRRNGDRMQVYGLNGSKKVKDIFIDKKIAPRKRDLMPLVVDAESRVLWIPGIKRSAHAVVTEDTTRYLYIRIYGKQSELG